MSLRLRAIPCVIGGVLRNSHGSRALLYVFVATLLSVLVTLPLVAQGIIKKTEVRPAADSLLLSDTVRTSKEVVPPVPLYEPSHRHGEWNWLGDSSPWTIDRHEIQPKFYSSFDDLLESSAPGVPLHQGYYALPNTMRVLGGSANDNALLFNGRPLNDVTSGQALMNLFPTEFMQKAEILLGSDAVVVADNASGMALNVQEPRYNAKKAYTRLWYAEGANGYISSDGVFSQNIAPNVNMTLGYRREAGDGRFTNQAVDSWNLRALFRWNLSDATSVSLVELFSNRLMDLNGGIDTAGTVDINDELSARVRFPLMNERLISHDISATLTTRLAADSSSRLQLNAYYSHRLWHLGRDSSMIFSTDSALGLNWTNVRSGIQGRLEQDFFGHIRMSLGADAEMQSSDSYDYAKGDTRLRLAAFAQTRLQLSSALNLSGGARLQVLGGTTALNVGARLHTDLSKSWSLTIDASQSARIPSLSEGVQLNQEHATLVFAKLGFADSTTKFSLLVFSRYLTNTISAAALYDPSSVKIVNTLYSNGADRTISGATLDGTYSFGSWSVGAQAQFHATQSGSVNDKLLPAVALRTGVEYRYPIARNMLSIGVAAKARSAYYGEAFIPQTWAYIPAEREQSAAFGGLEFLAGARIGDAFIKLAYQNILSNSTSSLSTFPAVVRNLSLSIAWTFFD